MKKWYKIEYEILEKRSRCKFDKLESDLYEYVPVTKYTESIREANKLLKENKGAKLSIVLRKRL